MGSTGDADRKRRHFSSISPTAATAKKPPFAPLSEDRKLDTAVLKFQNQKLAQKLEVQKIECSALENKVSQLRDKQLTYDRTLELVDESWNELINDIESRSKDLVSRISDHPPVKDGASVPQQDVFLRRLLETGATESCSACSSPSEIYEDRDADNVKSKDILCNIVSAIDVSWSLKDGLYSMMTLSGDGSGSQNSSDDLERRVKSLRSAVGDIHLKHRSLARELQISRDTDARNKAELKRLKGELECTIAELEDSNLKLATLKAERDSPSLLKGAVLPVLLGNKHVASDRTRDKHKDLHEMESVLKDLSEQASSRKIELKQLLEERIDILKRLASLQNTLKDVKGIFSSKACALLRDQTAKAKADITQFQALYEKLQVERDNIAWIEKEGNLKNDVVDVLHVSSDLAKSRIAELEIEIQKQIDGRNLLEAKLEEASKGLGRKEIIAEFKALVSSFPNVMGSKGTELRKYKEAASDVHALRAEVQSLSNVIERKSKELEALNDKSAHQVAEIQRLRALIRELERTDYELKLFLEAYWHNSTDPSDVFEARNAEIKAWAHAQRLGSSLNEHKLERRVKTAIEAEATSQQRLAAAEAEIGELRQKFENFKREKSRLEDNLKSKHEENEAYLSEIENIGQAYEDIQTKNQNHLQQITERDDYNIKLVLEGVRERQNRDGLLMERRMLERKVQQNNTLVDFYGRKTTRMEQQVKSCSDQVQKLSEDRVQSSLTLENTGKRLSEVLRSSQLLRGSLEELQTKIENSRLRFSELQIELEKERFEKKRLEEDVQAMRRKASRLRSQLDGPSPVQKLQKELAEYKDILKCSICHDRQKEVVITKCYHLFCSRCVQKILESRQRKCHVCSTSFGPNDVKPVYI